MNEKLLKASDYGDRENQAVFQVLVELAQTLGARHGSFVIVGGSVPSLLFENATPEHVGTLDIDLDLNPEVLGDYDYAELVEEHSTPLVDGLKVQRIDGGIYALKHYQEITLDGQMPDGRGNLVKILVATPPALLVMKGYALVGRDKQKDAYDIWFCIRNYEGGIEALAEACKPLLEEEEARVAYLYIAEKFRNENDFGPETVRRFLEGSPDKCGDMTPDQIQTDAYLRVSKWCELLGIKQ